jgi:hypothetical protein
MRQKILNLLRWYGFDRHEEQAFNRAVSYYGLESHPNKFADFLFREYDAFKPHRMPWSYDLGWY